VQWGFTTASHPTVWLSAPEGLEEGVAIEFALWNQAQLVHRSTHSTASAPAGSVSLTPTDAPTLELGEVYYWTVSIFCDAETPDVPVTIGAYIQRIAAPENWDATAEPLQQSAAYARAGIWYDALTVLGNQYREDGNSAIADAWTTLLQQANLSPALPVGGYGERQGSM
jgi:hypothetical protein